MKSLEHREAEAKDKAQRLLTRARHETGVNSPDENAELMQVGGCVCVRACVRVRVWWRMREVVNQELRKRGMNDFTPVCFHRDFISQ